MSAFAAMGPVRPSRSLVAVPDPFVAGAGESRLPSPRRERFRHPASDIMKFDSDFMLHRFYISIAYNLENANSDAPDASLPANNGKIFGRITHISYYFSL